MLQGDIPFEEDDDIAKAAPNFYRPISQGEGTMCAVLNVSRDHYCWAFSVRLYLTLCIVCIYKDHSGDQVCSCGLDRQVVLIWR